MRGQSVSITLRLTNVVPITELLVGSVTSNPSGDFGGNTEFTYIDPAGTAVTRGSFLELSTAGGVDEWTFMLMANDDSDTQTESTDFSLTVSANFLNEAGGSARSQFFSRTFRLTINPAGTVIVPALSVAAAPTTITEGAASTITITASTAPADDLTIPYTIAGTGIAVGDYTLADAGGTELTGLTGNITLAGSATSVALTLTAADDADASAEMLTFTLNTPVSGAGYTVTTATATITIDPAAAAPLPTVQFTTTTATVAEGDGTVDLTLELSEAATEEFRVTVNTSGGGGSTLASFPDDYTTANSTVTFGIGDTTQTVGIAIVDDALVEPDETFRVSIAGLNAEASALVTRGARAGVTVTIESEDTTMVSFGGSTQIGEDSPIDRDFQRLALTNPFGQDTVIPLMYTAGTATVNLDYMPVPSSVTISAGATSQNFRVLIINDNLDEIQENFTISFGDLPPGAIAGAQPTYRITIVDDDDPAPAVPALSVAASPTTITEGAASTITITASTAPADDLTIAYTIAGTGIAVGDYTLADASGTELTGLTGNITLAGSATSVALTLTAADDSDASAEMLTFTLGAGTGYTVATATATITIDPAVAATLPTVQFSAATTATVAEGDGTVVLTLELSEAVTEEFQVTVNTNGLTASFRDDYMSAGSVIFAVGDTMQTVSIPIVDDDVVETDETFRASISALDPAYTAVVMLGTRLFVTVTITDDDEAAPTPALSVAAAPPSIQEGQTSTITITADSAPADDLTIPFTITGVATSDYTLTAGSTTLAGLTGEVTLAGSATEVTLTLTAVDDSDAAAETLTFTLDTPSGTDYTLTTSAATITITPRGVVSLSVAADRASTIEGETVLITITASAAPAADLTIPFTIAGMNIEAADYTLTDMTPILVTDAATFPAGETSMVLLMAVEDDEDTAVEMLTFTLTAAADDAGYTVGATDAATVAINPREERASGSLAPVGRPILTVGVSSDSIEEGARTRITINAVPAPSTALTIPFAISGTGITSADYALATLTGTPVTTDQVTMPVGAASVALLLTALDDADATQTLNFQTDGSGTGCRLHAEQGV